MDGDNKANIERLTTSDALFKPANWLAKIDFINHLVLSNNVLITVLAEHGGGKTSFSRLLKQEIGAGVQTHVFKASPTFCSTDLLAELGKIFHKKVDASTTMINMVEHINQQNKHFLLIIDDAQNVSPVFLQEIMMDIKRYENSMFFHICLVSDYKILQHLHKFEAGQFDNLIHTIELGTLTERETNTWVLNKTHVRSQINNSRLEEFYYLTGGSVARINSQMAGFFGIEPSLPLKKVKRPVSVRFNQLASVIFVMAFFNWLWHTNHQSSEVMQDAKIDVKQPAKIIESKAVEAALHSKIPPYFIASNIQTLQPSSRNLVVDYADGEDSELEKLVLMDKVVVVPSVIHAHRSARADILVSSLPAVGKLVAKKDIINLFGSRYTIQLLASKRQGDLEKFIATQHIKSQFKIGLTRRKGSDWYVLTMGEFGKRELAQQAINKLPADISKFKPWVRSAKDLKVIG